MISIQNLSVSYQKNIPVLHNLSLDLEEKTIHGIVGLNGAGKSTLLNTIYGLQRADTGEIRWRDGKLLKTHMCFLPTENFFYSDITGREYLSLFDNASFDADEWNALFSIPLDGFIDDYSTGMKKKLAFLGVVKTNKPVMIMDEPFNGLDIETCRIVRTLLLKLKEQGKTIIITSHILETLTNLCDVIHYLEGGVIHSSRNKEEFDGLEQEIFTSIETRNAAKIDGLFGAPSADRI